MLEVQVGRIEVDVPEWEDYFGGFAAAVDLGMIEPPLALFIAAALLFEAMTNTALPGRCRSSAKCSKAQLSQWEVTPTESFN